MKKYLLFLLALIFLFSCEKESAVDLMPLPGLETYGNDSVTFRGEKRDVCHNGNIINISINAIPAHQAHGDAVDMDEDGYFDIDNPCSLTDCNDSIYDPENACGCVEGELEVILPDNTVLYVYPADNDGSISWGEYGNDIDGLANVIYGLPAANADFNGDANTAFIVAELGNYKGGDYAANLCATLSSETGCEWYLPSAGELNAMYQQLGPTTNGFGGSGDMPDKIYWSSTEQNAHSAWKQFFGSGFQNWGSKYEEYSCRCVRK